MVWHFVPLLLLVNISSYQWYTAISYIFFMCYNEQFYLSLKVFKICNLIFIYKLMKNICRIKHIKKQFSFFTTPPPSKKWRNFSLIAILDRGITQVCLVSLKIYSVKCRKYPTTTQIMYYLGLGWTTKNFATQK